MATESAWTDKLRACIGPRFVLLTFGASLMWSLFRPSITFKLMELPATQLWNRNETESYLLLLAGMALAVAVFVIPRLNRAPENSPLFGICCACAACGYAVLSCTPLASADIQQALYAAGNVLSGFGATGLWIGVLSDMAKLGGIAPSLGIAASFLLNCLFVIMISVMPASVAKIAMIASPVLIYGFALAARKAQGPGQAFDKRQRQSPSPYPPKKDLVYLLVTMYLGTLVWGVVFSTTTEAITLSEHIVTGTLSLFVMGIVIAHIVMGGNPKVLRTSRTVLILLLAAGLMLAQLLQMENIFMATGVITTATRCLKLLCWILVVGAAQRSSTGTSRLFGASFLVIETIPTLLGNVALPFAITQIAPSVGKAAVDTLVLVVLFILVVTMAVFFNSQAKSTETVFQGDAEETGGPSEHAAPYKEACRRIAERSALTPREEEVMRLLAKGFSQKKIAQELFMADGTVRGYVRTVYAKTAVHSKQELIDLVTAEKDGTKSDPANSEG